MKAIYVISFNDASLIYFKVGSCGNIFNEVYSSKYKKRTIEHLLKQRLSTLQIGNPFKLEVESYYKTGKNIERIERFIHHKLKSYPTITYIRGEWFSTHSEYIKGITDYIHELINDF